MTTSNTQESMADGPTWRRCAVVVLATMVVGLIVAWALTRVWFAPPLLALTPLVSLVAISVWLPVTLVCALRRPQGRRLTLLLLVVVGLFSCLIGLTLAGPSAGLLLPSAYGGPVTCEQETTAAGRVRYTCLRPDVLGAQEMVLEGEAGWPFVRLVEVRRLD